MHNAHIEFIYITVCPQLTDSDRMGQIPPTISILGGRGVQLIESEPVFLNVYGAQESIPRNEFRQPM